MILINQTTKDAEDYDVPLAGAPIEYITNFLTPKMRNEMLALWLEHKGFTKDGHIKPELIEADYLHVVEEYSYRTGYSQMVYITRKGIEVLASTFKTDYLTEEQYKKILDDQEMNVPTEKAIFIDGKAWAGKNFTSPGQVYPTYDGCVTLIDAAKLIISETYGMPDNVEDFLRYFWEKEIIDKYGNPSDKALNSGIFKKAVQVLKWKSIDDEVASANYPFTLVTQKGIDFLKNEWENKAGIIELK